MKDADELSTQVHARSMDCSVYRSLSGACTDGYKDKDSKAGMHTHSQEETLLIVIVAISCKTVYREGIFSLC